jgi:hypothetical protein
MPAPCRAGSQWQVWPEYQVPGRGWPVRPPHGKPGQRALVRDRLVLRLRLLVERRRWFQVVNMALPTGRVACSVPVGRCTGPSRGGAARREDRGPSGCPFLNSIWLRSSGTLRVADTTRRCHRRGTSNFGAGVCGQFRNQGHHHSTRRETGDRSDRPARRVVDSREGALPPTSSPGGNRPEGHCRRGFFRTTVPGSDKLKRSARRPERREGG